MESLYRFIPEYLVNNIGWTLIHFLWQGLLVMLLLWLALTAMKKSSASLRYGITLAAMIIMTAAPIATYILIAEPAPEQAIIELETIPAMPAAETIVSSSQPIPQEIAIFEPAGNITIEEETPLLERIKTGIDNYLPFCVCGWIIGVCIIGTWNMGGAWQLRRLRRIGTSKVATEIKQLGAKLAQKMNIKGHIEICESALVQVPTVIGWFKPLILLPGSALTGLDTLQLQALLAHELAHIKRYDFIINIYQTIIETLGFYHPGIWWISRQIRIERENCCDDIAIAVTENRKQYATALFTMESIRHKQLELAIAANGGKLSSRIERLANKERKASKSWLPTITTFAILASLVISINIIENTKAAEAKTEINTIELSKEELATVEFEQNAKEEFYKHYSLLPNENVKLVKQPFIPERISFYKHSNYIQWEAIPEMYSMRIKWDKGELKGNGWGLFDNDIGLNITEILSFALKINHDKFICDKTLDNIRTHGDWVFRECSENERLTAMHEILLREHGIDLEICKAEIETDIIIANGTYKYTPNQMFDDDKIMLYAEPITHETRTYIGYYAQTASNIVNAINNLSHFNCINNITNKEELAQKSIVWDRYIIDIRNPDMVNRFQVLRKILDNLSKQTSLTFTIEKQPVTKWVIYDKAKYNSKEEALKSILTESHYITNIEESTEKDRMVDLEREMKAKEEFDSIHKEQFYNTYSLAENENIKLVKPPYTVERLAFYKADQYGSWEHNQQGPSSLTLDWDGNKIKGHGSFYRDGFQHNLSHIINFSLSIGKERFLADSQMLDISIPGDWIVREGISEQQKLIALQDILLNEIGIDTVVSKININCDTIIAKGTYSFTPANGYHRSDRVVYYSDKMDTSSGSGGSTAKTVNELITTLSELTGLNAIDQTTNSKEIINRSIDWNSSSKIAGDEQETKFQRLNLMLKNLSRQTGIQFTIEKRPVTKWLIYNNKKYSSDDEALEATLPHLDKKNWLTYNTENPETTATELEIPIDFGLENQSSYKWFSLSINEMLHLGNSPHGLVFNDNNNEPWMQINNIKFEKEDKTLLTSINYSTLCEEEITPQIDLVFLDSSDSIVSGKTFMCHTTQKPYYNGYRVNTAENIAGKIIVANPDKIAKFGIYCHHGKQSQAAAAKEKEKINISNMVLCISNLSSNNITDPQLKEIAIAMEKRRNASNKELKTFWLNNDLKNDVISLTNNNGKILSPPGVTIFDGENAALQLGSEIPIEREAGKFEYINEGMKFNYKADIVNDNQIKLSANIESEYICRDENGNHTQTTVGSNADFIVNCLAGQTVMMILPPEFCSSYQFNDLEKLEHPNFILLISPEIIDEAKTDTTYKSDNSFSPEIIFDNTHTSKTLWGEQDNIAKTQINSENIRGKVYLPDGSPAVNARLGIATLKEYLKVDDFTFNKDCKYINYTTDSKGAFKLPKVEGTFTVYVLHDFGYAEINGEKLLKENSITLQQWAKVNGKLMIGTEPGAGKEVCAYVKRYTDLDNPEPLVWKNNTCLTNENGRFHFDHIEAGMGRVYQRIRCHTIQSGYYTQQSQLQPIIFRPGETQTVTIGGKGRRVVGKLAFPDNYIGPKDLSNNSGLLLRTENSTLPVPDEYYNWTSKKQNEWFRQWLKSEEGIASGKKDFFAYKEFAVILKEDGSFYADDITEGDYILDVTIYEPEGKDRIGRAYQKINVGPMSGGRSDEPLNIGNITFNMHENIKVGLDAPDFTANDMKGNEIKLSDYKGKYVLLNFWATWCGFCISEIPDLKEVYKKYKDNDKFIMLDFSLDDNTESVVKLHNEKGVKWQQCIDHAGFNSDTVKKYKLKMIPAIFLISPEGKIIEKELRGEKIMQTVDKYLKTERN